MSGADEVEAVGGGVGGRDAVNSGLDFVSRNTAVVTAIVSFRQYSDTRVREYVFYVFSDFKKHDFLRFFEIAYQKVKSRKNL